MRPAESDHSEKIEAPPAESSRRTGFFVHPPGAERAPLLLRLRWGRLFLASLVAVVTGYGLVATAAYVFFRYHRGIEAVAWTDFALPSRWPRFRAAQGDQQIAQAEKLAREGRLREALIYVRTGVARSPAHRDGRILLARLLVAARRPDAAQATMLAGLPYHRGDPAFLAPLFEMLLQRQEDDRLIALAREFQSQPAPPAAQRLAALAGAAASFFRGNYDQTDDFLRVIPSLAESRDGRLLMAKVHGERGERNRELLELRALAAEFPADAEIHSVLVSRLRQSGLADEARRASLRFQLAHPDLPAPRIELLHAYREAGDIPRVTREIETLLREFPANPAALLALADFAANVGDAALARRLTAHARAQKLPWEPHAFLTVEALIVARDYRGAVDTIEALMRENPAWAQDYRALLDSLQAVSYLGLGEPETSRLHLANFMSQPALRAENLLALANRFAAFGADEPARQILARAVTVDPLNQAAITRLVEFDLNLNRIDELPGHLQQLLKLRKPSPDILRVAQLKLGSDLFLYSADRAPALDAVRAALDKPRAPARY